ncbi:General substrate transporter [Syntrophomonas zehnderi OL-4]|uniref:Putative proline/betaine transporter n=1 Tax=Syntrophomonas zehnderi OL-4 TaxID=690567 RepID=A0A0E4GC46_9FIRM|nr:MFS transporter [Syntrophomonas zehnderi]CFX89254.1 General substrate transporter [Syntrophomonas zehnderi OL-4]
MGNNDNHSHHEYVVQLRKAVFGAAIGNMIEWFDYASYGYLATIIAVVFFAPGDKTAALLGAFAVFAVPFIIRPLGGIFWGHYGDKIGRRRTLIYTISIMSVATFCIGLLPSYAKVGVLAPVLLFLIRLLQGFAASGEYAGSASFIAEYAPNNKRGLLVSMVPASTAAGLMFAALITAILDYYLSPGALNSWGWRIPFLLALPLGIIGLTIRLRLEDTPVFKEMEEKTKQTNEDEKRGLAELGKYWKELIIAFGVVLLNAVGFYTILSYMPTYLMEQMHFSRLHGTLITLVTLFTYVFMLPLVGTLADHVGRKKVLMVTCVIFILATYPIFHLLAMGKFLAVLALFLLGACLAGNDGVLATFLTEMFPTSVRFTSFGLVFNTGNAIFGGTAPLMATYLIAKTGNEYAPAFYLIAAACVCLLALTQTHETANKELER